MTGNALSLFRTSFSALSGQFGNNMKEPSSTSIPPLARTSSQILIVLIAAGFFLFQIATRSRDLPTPASSASQESVSFDLNVATPRELSLLPSIGPVLAERIAQDRDSNGLFRSLDDVQRVRGVGEKTLDVIRKYCFVDQERIESTDSSANEVAAVTMP